jgi:hypothetical protein
VQRGRAHHTEHELDVSRTLLANLFETGRTYLFDLRRPTAPAIVRSFDQIGPYFHPHSFVRLADGNILATFQSGNHDGTSAGGLVEFSPDGRILHVSPPADSGNVGFVRPYSLAVVPSLRMVVTTGYDMHQRGTTRVVQLWRLPDLALVRTLELPPGPRGVEGLDSSEPRLLADGRTVLVVTYKCGLYRLTDIDAPHPAAEFVFDFHGQDCALPVLVGSFWIQTVPPRSIVALDVSSPAKPREVSQLQLESDASPHWIAREPVGSRLAITGVGGLLNRIVIARVDPSGQLSLDPLFVDSDGKPGIRIDGVPHGVVFSR